MDEELDRIAFHLVSPTIYSVFQIGAGQYGAGSHHQSLQQGELTIGEVHGLAIVDMRFTRGRIERNSTIGQ